MYSLIQIEYLVIYKYVNKKLKRRKFVAITESYVRITNVSGISHRILINRLIKT